MSGEETEKKEDLVLEGRLVLPEGVFRKQVKVSRVNGLVEEVDKTIFAKRYFCFSDDTLIFPGFVDIHVHAREDSSGLQNYKEDFETVAAAALNGGVIALADMPNNPSAPIDERSYLEKKKLAEKSTIPLVVYAGIGPNSRPLLQKAPYKAFLGPTAKKLSFNSLDALERKLRDYSEANVSFHCEHPGVMVANAQKEYHEDRQPREAEVEGIKLVLQMTRDYRLTTKICHVSTKEGLELCLEAKRAGLQVTLEVAPHHLYFDRTMLNESNRKLLQVNPPLRDPEDREYLLCGLREGKIDYLASDHAPHTLEDKEKGVSGIPHLDTYGLFVSWLMGEHKISPQRIAQVCSYNPGKFVNEHLGTKMGLIRTGYLGKFTTVNLSGTTAVAKENLKTKCGWSPFEGVIFPGRVSVFPEF